MLRKFILFAAAVMFIQPVLAETFFEGEAAAENSIQSRIDNVGTTLLNYNKIPHRIIFVYDKKKRKILFLLIKI